GSPPSRTHLKLGNFLESGRYVPAGGKRQGAAEGPAFSSRRKVVPKILLVPRPSLRAAVFEPDLGERKRLLEGLGRVKGVTVSRAESPEKLRNESWVVLGPTLSRPARWAQAVRQAKEGVRVMVAQREPKAASFADAVLPLPVSPRD